MSHHKFDSHKQQEDGTCVHVDGSLHIGVQRPTRRCELSAQATQAIQFETVEL